MRKLAKIVFTTLMLGVFILGAPLALSGCSLFGKAPEKGKALDDYTFEELSQISSLIQKSDNPNKTASEYGICDEQGKIKDQIKRFKLKDDTVCEVRVVGIMHDKLTPDQNEKGFFGFLDPTPEPTKAGLTFMCAEVPCQAQWNVNPVAEGGWQSSNLRSYLAEKVIENLPDYLKKKIVSVEKLTNNVGFTDNAASVTATQDKLWSPSAKEINGDVNWDAVEYYNGTRPNDTVLNAEGEQYQWFKQQVDPSTGNIPNGKLEMTFKGHETSWWYRSIFPTSTKFGSPPVSLCVMTSGYSHGTQAVTDTSGVAFGFCL